MFSGDLVELINYIVKLKSMEDSSAIPMPTYDTDSKSTYMPSMGGNRTGIEHPLYPINSDIPQQFRDNNIISREQAIMNFYNALGIPRGKF